MALSKEAGEGYIPEMLLRRKLSVEQWKQLEEINHSLAEEYSVRREMLLKRLDVTIQSFKWSDRAKKLLDKIESTFQPKRRLLTSASSIDCSDILFAGTDLTTVMKTSNSAVRQNTQTNLTKLVIGDVPDRGGRPTESRPPPEMPRFRPVRAQPHSSRKLPHECAHSSHTRTQLTRTRRGHPVEPRSSARGAATKAAASRVVSCPQVYDVLFSFFAPHARTHTFSHTLAQHAHTYQVGSKKAGAADMVVVVVVVVVEMGGAAGGKAGDAKLTLTEN